jgi:hypothetical protein
MSEYYFHSALLIARQIQISRNLSEPTYVLNTKPEHAIPRGLMFL